MRQAPLLALILPILAAVPAFSQDRPRVLDNFSFSGGVEVTRTEFIPAPIKNKRLLKPAAVNKLVQKTAMVEKVPPKPTRMGVTEGLAAREAPRTQYAKLNPGSNTQLKGFTTGDILIDSYIVDSSHRYGIDPLLIYSQMHQESSFKLGATSPKGASGLMQLMPGTARRMGVVNIYNPKENIEGGVKYMRLLLDMFGGDINLALAGYNAGEGAVMRYGNQIPPYNETQEYVRRISARYNSISDGSYARTMLRVSGTNAAKLEKKDSLPLAMYEPSAMAIRLPDGTMRLVNQ
jgi:hypothetical protein